MVKCGWCKEELKEINVKSHPCMDVMKHCHSYILRDNEFFPQTGKLSVKIPFDLELFCILHFR